MKLTLRQLIDNGLLRSVNKIVIYNEDFESTKIEIGDTILWVENDVYVFTFKLDQVPQSDHSHAALILVDEHGVEHSVQFIHMAIINPLNFYKTPKKSFWSIKKKSYLFDDMINYKDYRIYENLKHDLYVPKNKWIEKIITLITIGIIYLCFYLFLQYLKSLM